MKRIVIVGGGFAGMMAAANAVDEIGPGDDELEIVVISPVPYLTIRPRLYERDPETLRAPLRPTFDPLGIELIEGTVTDIDTESRSVTIASADGTVNEQPWDRLILATGSELRPTGIQGAAEHAWNIDTYDAAVAFDRHLRDIVRDPDAPGHDAFAIVGGGMSGIEIALEMRRRLAVHGDAAVAAAARIVLIEQADCVGPEFGDDPRPVIESALEDAGVELRLGATVARIEGDGVALADGERIDCATTIVTVGLTANGLGAASPAERDELGRLPVDEYQRVTGVDGVYATGDIARAWVDDGHLALMSCQHARTMGKYAGRNAAADLLGHAPIVYRQPNYTTCLDLGETGAVITMGWDRKVHATGEEAKTRKRFINSELIYPPLGDRAEILAAARIDPETGR